MIDRYTLPEFKKIWSDQFKFTKMLEVELAAIAYYHHQKVISDQDYQALLKASFDLDQIQAIEQIRHHDVIAFCEAVGLTLGPEKRYFHYGLTSTDVVDTALVLILKEANTLINQSLDQFEAVLKKQALKYKDTPCIGRTHGMHAEVTSFGLKWCLYYDELLRIRSQFDLSTRNLVGKISGAVGNYSITTPQLEEFVCLKLGIGYAKISTQVLSRDRFASYLFSLASISSLLEKIAIEIRHLARSEVGEVREYFDQNQKGSSAMPHKRNPIASENICGCARLMRSYVQVAMENNPLWHERDISHSSAERVVLADATTLIYYMLKRYTKVLDRLIVDQDQMVNNLNLHQGLIYSGAILNALVDQGLTREDAYQLVQPLCFQCFQEKQPFYQLLINSPITNYLSIDQLKSLLNYQTYLKSVDYIYQRLNLEVI